MKRFICLPFFALLLAAAVSCGSDDDPVPAPVPLAAPALSASEVSDGSFTVVWERVEHADSYVYTLDGGDEASTAAPRVTFAGVEAGEHTVRVKALSGTPSAYADSSWSELKVTIEQSAAAEPLATPELTLTGKTENSLVVSWQAVPNAERYVCRLDDGDETETDKLFAAFSRLAPGDYTVRVKAVPDDSGAYAESAWGELEVAIAEAKPVLEVRLYPDELQPQNVVFANIRTERCEAIYVGALDAGISEEEAVGRLTAGGYALGVPEVAVANTPSGYDKEMRGLMPDTEYAVCVYARYANGSTAFFSDNITTVAVPEMDPRLAAWIGSYTVTSTDAIRFKGKDGATKGMPASYEQLGTPMTFDITIRAYAKDTKYVEIIDWCQIRYLAPWPMLAQLTDEGDLALLTKGVGYGTIDGYATEVTAFLLLESGDIAPVSTLPYSFIFHDDGTSIRSTAVSGLANGQPYTAYATDVIGKDALYGSMYFYELPKDIPAGEFTLVRKPDASAAAMQQGRTPVMNPGLKSAPFASVPQAK